MADASQEAPLTSVLNELSASGHEEAVSIGEILDAFEHRSLGVLLTLFGLIATLPVIGGIPGMSILTGTLVLVAVGQSFAGQAGLWAPRFVRQREIGRRRFNRVVEKACPWTRRVDNLLKPRLRPLVAGSIQRWILSIAAVLLALTFYPLAFVPFGVTAPAAGVLALGLGLMAGDGLLVLIGYALSAVTAYLMVTTL